MYIVCMVPPFVLASTGNPKEHHNFVTPARPNPPNAQARLCDPASRAASGAVSARHTRNGELFGGRCLESVPIGGVVGVLSLFVRGTPCFGWGFKGEQDNHWLVP